MTYLVKGMQREAVETLEKARDLTGDGSVVLAGLAHARAVGGDRSDAERLLREFGDRGDVSPVSLASLHLDVGDREGAFRLLAKAVEERAPLSNVLKMDPLFAGLRGDPGFRALLRQMRLAD
jgi:hypothetical protein